jgi:hypothetical protein
LGDYGKYGKFSGQGHGKLLQAETKIPTPRTRATLNEPEPVAFFPARRCSPADLFDPSDSAAFQPNLYTVGMSWGFGQDVFDNPLGEPAGALILFQNDEDPETGLYITASRPAHGCSFFVFFEYR